MSRLMNRNRALPRLAAAPVKTALLCTAAFITTGAIAATPAAQSINVRYTAADLTRPDDARRLYLRIQRAARAVCVEPDIRDLAAHGKYRDCYEHAVDDAVAKVGAAALTALHRSKTQRNASG